MSFFGKFKAGSTPSNAANGIASKKDPNAPVPTPLEKHLQDAHGPVRPDGSDKFFGFENYGSTCYANSVIQCLYYSQPFRDNVLSFPPKAYLDNVATAKANGNGALLSPRGAGSTTPYPNPNSPARKVAPVTPGSPNVATESKESKESPESRKKLAITTGPVLEMTFDNSVRYGMDESLFTSLKDIFEAITRNQSRIGVVSPHKFLEILRRENEMFRSAMHQDAHEFLNLLLNQAIDNVELFAKQHPILPPQMNGGVAEDEKGLATATGNAVSNSHGLTNGMDTHWVHDLFEGTLTSETRCLTCENTSQRDEAFLDLSVDLAPHTSVTSCLRKFSEEEMLCERNKFHCDNCGGLQEAEKRMKIKRLPRILALHLKRFKYTEDLQRLQKLFHKVQYPYHLRLFNTTDDAEDPDRLYELYAVVVHIGGGPYHGHYVSIIKTQDRGWLLFDDELVEPVDKSYVLNFFGGEPVPGVQDAKQLACAYVLFYQETTLEAMLKEQEMEGQQPSPMDSRVSDAGTAKDEGFGATKLQQTQTVMTPTREDMEHMESLAHAHTAPLTSTTPGGAVRSPFESSNPVLQPILPPKSKKEMKAEEKSRKLREKEEQKAAELKRKEQSTKRMEAWRKQEEDLKRVLEESKMTAAEDMKRAGVDESAVASVDKEREGGLARFRHGSMSLRSKPKLFGNNKGDSEKLASVPQRSATVSAPKDSNGDAGAGEEKKSKNRFSLGKKKSQGVL